MMFDEDSPFFPGQVVAPSSFLGRQVEVRAIESAFLRCKGGAPTLVFVEGERGIGKTSLAHYARRHLEASEDAATAYVMLSHARTTEDAIRMMLEHLVSKNLQSGWAKKVAGHLKSVFSEVSFLGVSLTLGSKSGEMERFKEHFVSQMQAIQDVLSSAGRSGLLIVLDEIDHLAQAAEFAIWLKAVADEGALQSDGLRMCIVLCGYEERRRSLINSHPSLGRAMKLVRVDPWSRTDSMRFYQRAFEAGGAQLETSVAPLLADTSGGIPAYAHEIGHAVWCEAEGPIVTESHAWEGLVRAANVIGMKIFKPTVLDAIRSRKYRAMLRKLAKKDLTIKFTRRALIDDLTANEKRVLDSFLSKLKGLGAITRDEEGGRGSYQFASYMHRLYFWLEARNAERES